MKRLTGLPVLVLLAGCVTFAPTPTTNQDLVLTNLSPRVVLVEVGWVSSGPPPSPPADSAYAVLGPCGGRTTITIRPGMWLDKGGVRGLPADLNIDSSFNADALFGQFEQRSPGSSPGIADLRPRLLSSIWTLGDITTLPLAVVVDPDVSVRAVDPSAAQPTLAACTPQTKPAP